jgi:hypothetical protein
MTTANPDFTEVADFNYWDSVSKKTVPLYRRRSAAEQDAARNVFDTMERLFGWDSAMQLWATVRDQVSLEDARWKIRRWLAQRALDGFFGDFRRVHEKINLMVDHFENILRPTKENWKYCTRTDMPYLFRYFQESFPELAQKELEANSGPVLDPIKLEKSSTARSDDEAVYTPRVRRGSECLRHAKDGYPVALKVLSPAVRHMLINAMEKACTCLPPTRSESDGELPSRRLRRRPDFYTPY